MKYSSSSSNADPHHSIHNISQLISVPLNPSGDIIKIYGKQMGGMNRFIALFFLVCLLKGDCSTSGCLSCTTALVGSSFVETCTACGTGFKVSVNGGCDFDVGLVLGVGIGAIIIIALQISCFCFCRMYFKQVQKKKSQYTL